MKFDPQKAFPYPVLRPDVDDYVDGGFQTVVDFSGGDDGSVKATIRMVLSVPEINRLIENGQAEFVTVFACRETYYRESIRSKEPDCETTFKTGTFKGEVTVYPFVLASERIEGFQCRDINPEYGAGPFIFEAGEVLALDEPKVIYIDRDLFKPVSSVFELCKDDNLTGFEWQLGFDDDKVQIKVGAQTKDKIDVARNSVPNRAMLINSIYFGAVMEAISKLREGGDYDDLRWARVIRRQCHNLAIDIDAHDSHAVAQRMMKYPLGLLDLYVFRGDE